MEKTFYLLNPKWAFRIIPGAILLVIMGYNAFGVLSTNEVYNLIMHLALWGCIAVLAADFLMSMCRLLLKYPQIKVSEREFLYKDLFRNNKFAGDDIRVIYSSKGLLFDKLYIADTHSRELIYLSKLQFLSGKRLTESLKQSGVSVYQETN